MKKLCLFLIVLMFTGAASYSQFKIIGEIKGYKDSTIIYLDNYLQNTVIDSTYIINNQFFFEGKLNEPTLLSVVPSYKKLEEFEYRIFWGDNTIINITGEKGNLRYAPVKGSKHEKEASILHEIQKPIYKKIDSVHSEIRALSDEEKTKYRLLVDKQNEQVENIIQSNIAYIQKYPNHLHSISVLSAIKRELPKEKTILLFKALNSDLKSSKFGEDIRNYLELSKDFHVGDKIEDFHLDDLNGKKIGLCNYKNKYVLIEFWSSSCAPCRAENPILLKLYKKYNELGFEIIGVNLDLKKTDWKKAVKKDGITWPTVGDLKGIAGDVATTYNVRYMPMSFLIDEKGIIIAKDLRGAKLEAKLEEIFMNN